MRKTNQLRTIISADGVGFHSAMSKVRKSVKAAATAFATFTATGLILATKEAVAFEKQMAEVNTIGNLTVGELEKVRKQVLDLSTEFGASTDELTGGLYQALSASIPKGNAIEFLRVATKAGIAGVTDTATAVDGLTTILNAYQKESSEAGKISDMMFATVKGGKLNFEELSNSVGKAAGTAKLLGVSVDELLSGFVTMTKKGFTADEASTMLTQTMQGLITPSEELKDIYGKLNVETGTAAVKTFGFQQLLQKLIERTDGTAEGFKRLIPGIRGFKGLSALAGRSAIRALMD